MERRSSEFWYLLSSKSNITSCGDTRNQDRVWDDDVDQSFLIGNWSFNSYLDYVCKVFPFDVVVRLDEDLSEDRLANRVVLGVELVKPVERVAVLFWGMWHRKWRNTILTRILEHFDKESRPMLWLCTACTISSVCQKYFHTCINKPKKRRLSKVGLPDSTSN